MGNYSEHEDHVRVDFFKPSGKWYCTKSIKWIGYRGCIHTAFKESLAAISEDFSGMTAVCLDPYHEHSHPLMTVIE